MRVLLSTIGSRGDVQPLVALGLELKELGHDVRCCVPPDFREWIEALGLSVTPIGPTLRSTARPNPSGATPTAEQRRQMIEGTVAAQFQTIAAAAEGRDVIVGATALQVAAPSVAERLGIPYVFAAYCPTVLPSRHHPPPVLTMLGDKPATDLDDYSALWEADAQRWNAGWLDVLNAQRTGLGLPAVPDVREYVLTRHPWLAADPSLGPWPGNGLAVFQTGAWILPDRRPLSPELERFLEAGSPPVYIGFGSIRFPEAVALSMISAARALGRRVLVSRGWADLVPAEGDPDCLSIDETNHHLLFPRVAAVVHHGGAGTTTAAARAGTSQVVIPQHYDQHYWARRVDELGIGVALATNTPDPNAMARAMERALSASVHAAARSFAATMRSDGARVAAERLTAEVSSGAD
ncbi:MAG: glycosyltransferase [Gemmatimonadaceae bacterium]